MNCDDNSLSGIRRRNEEAKAQYSGTHHPQFVRDIDYMLDLLSPARPTGDPVSQLAVVGSAVLERAEEGTRVLDATGDVWFKLPDGRWSFRNITTSSAQHLVQVFGPIRLLGETT